MVIFMDNVITNKKRKHITHLFSAMLIFSPLIGVMLLCAFQGDSLFNVFLPNTIWNDEVFYFKQIESIIDYGTPQGYFGYNEVPPNLLTFGAWSPVLFLPYVVLGYVFGWTIYSPILFNLIMVMASLFAFIVLTLPNSFQKICLSLFVISYTFLSRFIVSSMMEASSFAAFILLVSLFIYILDYSKSSIPVYFYFAITFFFSLSRPYFIIFLLPVFVCNLLKKRYLLCFLTIILSTTTLATYFWIEQNLCAPYYATVLNVSFSETIAEQGIFGFIVGLFSLVATGFKDMFDLFVSRDVGGIASIMYFSAFFQIVMLLITAKSIKTDNPKTKVSVALVAVSIFIMIVAIFCFYLIYNGARHLAPVIFVSVFIITRYNKKLSIISTMMSFVLFVIVAPFGNMYDYNFDIPFGNSEEVSQYNATSAHMQTAMKKPVSENKWDNTVAFIAADYNAQNGSYFETPWKPLYSVPSGYGINYIDYTSYQDDEDFSQIQSQYIIARTGSVSEQRALQNGGTMLMNGQNFVLIQN